MTDGNWGLLMAIWAALAGAPFLYLSLRASDDLEDQSHKRVTKSAVVFLGGLAGLFVLMGLELNLAWGIAWLTGCVGFVGWQLWRKQRVGPRSAATSKMALRLIFAGFAGFVICSLMADELAAFAFRLEGEPFYGGNYEIFHGPIPQVICALVAIYGSYLLLSQRLSK